MRSTSPRRASGFLHRVATLIGIGASSLVLSQALSSCGSEDSTACTPGAAQSCSGPGQCAGSQTCNDEGNGYDACDCGGGTAGTANAGGTGGGSGGSSNMSGSGGTHGTGIPTLTNQVGVGCAQDSDCPTVGNISMICLRSDQDEPFSDDVVIGGPQGGYCSYPCTAGGGECETLVDGNSGCGLLNEAGNGFCLGLCQPGADPTGQQLIKCGDNRAQACVQAGMNQGLGLCLPVCQSDEGCGNRFCDPGGLGLCVDEAPAGGGVGSPCTVDTEGEDCASGICLEYRDGEELVGSFCSANCTLGEFDAGCGFALGSTADREAACLARRFSTGGIGDLGFCIELCDVDQDCSQSGDGWVCDPFPGGLDAELGRAGGCIPAALLDEEGGADAAAPGRPAVPSAPAA